MGKTLISYQTLYGSTKEAASLISEVLKNDYKLEVDLHRFEENKEPPDLSEYDNIVIGSCIFHGKWGKKAESFLKEDFQGKKTAVFICAGFAGEKQLYKRAFKMFLKDVIDKYPHIKPISIEAFGGRIPKSKIPHIWLLRVTRKLPSFSSDNRNLDLIKDWAAELGKMFTAYE
jgi:menaquinone-dependent protoporphyrinogen IX oxidase